MILQPVDNRSRATAERTKALPIPSKGWNARDPVQEMEDGWAIRMRNWLVRKDGIHTRPGSSLWSLSLGNPVGALIEAGRRGKASRLLAAAGTNLYDVTLQHSRAAPEVLATGLTSSDLIWDRIANAGVDLVLMVNGADGVKVWNGAALLTATITGVNTAKLFSVVTHMRRAFFAERGTLDLWYLPPDSFQGEARRIMLAPVCRKGGEIVAIASLNSDGAASTDDRLVAVTSRGEMAVYAGSNPDNAKSWRLAGVWPVPLPIGGKRCLSTFGGDLVFMSTNGLLPVPAILGKPESAEQTLGLSDPIREAADFAALDAGRFAGWQIIESLHDWLLLINVPFRDGTRQLVLETRTNTWSEFTGLAATCWGRHGERVYYGTAAGTVYRFGVGSHDNYVPVAAELIPAFSYFGSQSIKTLRRARPHIKAPLGYIPRVEAIVDYDAVAASYPAYYTAASGQAWNAAWDAPWQSRRRQKFDWRGIGGRGTALTTIVSVKTMTDLVYGGMELMYETGGST